MSRILFALALICAAPAFAETRYFGDIPDLPIAPGLEETESAFGFPSESGGLVLARADGDATAEAIERFYGESLSALGWSYQLAPREDGQLYVRGRERMVMRTEPNGHGGTRLFVRLCGLRR